MATTTQAEVRYMTRRDMPAVYVIEAASSEYAWSKGDFDRILHSRLTVGRVAEIDGQVAGFAIYEIWKQEARILNFAVHPIFRRQFAGASLLNKIKATCTNARRTRITTEVRESNLDAQLFLRSQGFKAVRVLRDHYDECDNDAYVFQFKIPRASRKPQ